VKRLSVIAAAFIVAMQRLADLQTFYHAQLWILHDKAQSDTIKHAPQYYE
jgi:hypothetical protein